MSKIKRQLNNDTCSNESTKKLRTDLSTIIDPEKNSINCIENLSNELFFEIFDYLDGCSLYEAFTNLNTRFHQLLNLSSLRLKIVINSTTTNFAIPNKHQIISFRLSTFLSWFPVDSTFTHLESLTLTGIRSNKVVFLLPRLMDLPRLFSLTIHLDEYAIDLGFIYKLIFNLPKLKYNKLSSNVTDINVSSLKSNLSRFSSIEYLIIDHPCTVNDLITILCYTPQLIHLTCKKSLFKSDINIQQIESMKLSNLNYISIPFRHLPFDDFQIFIKSISSQLRVLKLYTNGDPSYLNADKWEKFISEHIPYLHKFRFVYVDIIRESLKITPYHERINRFTSAFWIGKQWIFDCAIKTWNGQDVAFIYRVFPRRYFNDNMCYSRNNEYQCKSSTSPTVFRPLSICNLSIMEDNKRIFEIIRPMLLVSSMDVLNIRCMEIYTDILIEFIRVLRNLNILVISSSAMMKSKYLSKEEEETALSYVSKNNTITKVILQQITEVEQVQFFLQLCPHMQHLELFCSNDIEPTTLLEFIFKSNFNYISNLVTVGVRLLDPNEESREKLQKISATGEFCQDYTIKQEDNRICLRRNKI